MQFGGAAAVFALILFQISTYVKAADTKGAVNLDSITFSKIIGKFPVTLVKFDVSYPYGDKHDEFVKLVEEVHAVPDLLLAEVGVKDYGDKENSDLAAKYNLKKDDFPSLKLFLAGKDEPITFDPSANFKVDEMKSFLKKHSDLYIGLSSCIKEFDEYASSFMKGAKPEREGILKKAESKAKELKDDRQKKSADTYVKVMRKVAEKGDEFVAKELERVSNIQKGKLTKEKKTEMQSKVNILQSFRLKDEL